MVIVVNTRRISITLWWIAGLLACSAVAVIVVGLTAPIEFSDAGAQAPPASPATTGIDANAPGPGVRQASPPLSAFATVWDADLRRPLFDPPPVTVAKPPSPPPPPPLTIRLVGTVVEPDRALGLFVTAGGKVEMKGAGQVVDGAKIISVNERGAIVLHHGRQVALTLEAEKPH